MKKKLLASLVLGVAACGAIFGLASCGNNDSKNNNTSTTVVDEGGEEDLGFTEVTIFEGVQKEFLNLNAVYFQPVDMTGGYKATDYDCHLELDVSALKNDFGYGTGDWVPYLTVEYLVKKGDKTVAQGTFMPMAASDGPHYGQNIKLDGDGTYSVTFTIKFPDTSSVYLIHTDNTGPEKSTFPNTITYTYDSWNFKNGAWNN